MILDRHRERRPQDVLTAYDEAMSGRTHHPDDVTNDAPNLHQETEDDECKRWARNSLAKSQPEVGLQQKVLDECVCEIPSVA